MYVLLCARECAAVRVLTTCVACAYESVLAGLNRTILPSQKKKKWVQSAGYLQSLPLMQTPGIQKLNKTGPR